MSEETKEKPIVDDTKQGLKLKSKPKKLVDKMPNNITHVDLSKDPKKDLQEAVTTKVEIPVEKVESEVTEIKEEKIEQIATITEIKEEEKEIVETKQQLKEAVRDEKVVGKQLPENIEKLVSFMEETGGSVQDYVSLNKDYSDLSPAQVLKEYYTKSKPHLDQEEISFLMEDNFDFDEDVDEAREIRKKKLAFKEEVANAKNYLESSKSKYYDEIKLRPGVTQEQQEALSFYDQYKKQQQQAQQLHGDFRDNTKKLFSNEFKGFDFNVGEKKFRYGIKDPAKVGETQVDVQNFVSKYTNDKGEVVDPAGYHKAMYSAMNADKIAHHFYEQGKADGIKNVISSSKNPSTDKPRQVADGNVFVNGLKVRSISGLDSTKLKIKTRKFN